MLNLNNFLNRNIVSWRGNATHLNSSYFNLGMGEMRMPLHTIADIKSIWPKLLLSRCFQWQVVDSIAPLVAPRLLSTNHPYNYFISTFRSRLYLTLVSFRSDWLQQTPEIFHLIDRIPRLREFLCEENL